MNERSPVVASGSSRIPIGREAQLDHYAAEMSVGLSVQEMRHLAAKILQDAEDLDNGELVPDTETGYGKEDTR